LAAFLAMMFTACSGQRPGEAEIPSDARVTHRAVFIGESNHDTIGTISLYQSPSYPVVVFEPNFQFQGANGAVVALGSDGYRASTILGALLRNTGEQAYAVPGGLDITRYNEVWLWSTDSDIPLGLARLTPI
jgi:hypothetical protein